MSLINDALKRAQESQRPSLPGSMAPLRPVERLVKPRRNVNWMIPVAVVCLIAAAALFIGLNVARHSANRVATAPEEISQPPAAPAVVTAPPAPASVASALVAPVARPTAPTTAPVSAAPAQVVAPLPLIGPAAIAAAAAAAAANSTPAEPAKPSLVIQGIVNDPVRPWAIISGRTFYIGDSIKGLRVSAISRNSVTLVGGGETNRLVVGQHQ